MRQGEYSLPRLMPHKGDSVIEARRISLQYKAPRSLAALARTLQLDVVVEGSVWFEEDRVRINIRLIDAVNEGQLWAHRFERPIRDVLVWQSEVARAIAQQIQVDITPSEDARLRNIENVHPDAHAAFHRGLYYWHQFFTEAGIRTSLSHSTARAFCGTCSS